VPIVAIRSLYDCGAARTAAIATRVIVAKPATRFRERQTRTKIEQLIARKAPRECVAMIVSIVSGTIASIVRRISLRRSAQPRWKRSGTPMHRARAKSLLSASMPPGPWMITSEPPERIIESPFFTPKKPKESAMIQTRTRR
jgi:hypothetical protein